MSLLLFQLLQKTDDLPLVLPLLPILPARQHQLHISFAPQQLCRHVISLQELYQILTNSLVAKPLTCLILNWLLSKLDILISQI